MISREIVLQTLNCGPIQYPQMLEDRFPHVLEKIVKLWNSHEAEPYFEDLLQPNGRGGGRFDRDGFPDLVVDPKPRHLAGQHLYRLPRFGCRARYAAPVARSVTAATDAGCRRSRPPGDGRHRSRLAPAHERGR